jgi:hypothetical protein
MRIEYWGRSGVLGELCERSARTECRIRQTLLRLPPARQGIYPSSPVRGVLNKSTSVLRRLAHPANNEIICARVRHCISLSRLWLRLSFSVVCEGVASCMERLKFQRSQRMTLGIRIRHRKPRYLRWDSHAASVTAPNLEPDERVRRMVTECRCSQRLERKKQRLRLEADQHERNASITLSAPLSFLGRRAMCRPRSGAGERQPGRSRLPRFRPRSVAEQQSGGPLLLDDSSGEKLSVFCAAPVADRLNAAHSVSRQEIRR